MSADQIIAEFRALPPDQRHRVAEMILREDESWIPESFRAGMADIALGRTTDLDTALTQSPLEE